VKQSASTSNVKNNQNQSEPKTKTTPKISSGRSSSRSRDNGRDNKTTQPPPAATLAKVHNKKVPTPASSSRQASKRKAELMEEDRNESPDTRSGKDSMEGLGEPRQQRNSKKGRWSLDVFEGVRRKALNRRSASCIQ